jgi:hypothetical protein
VWRPGTGEWFIRLSATNYETYRVHESGTDGDRPAPADYDGDGRVDPATWRPSTGQWFIRLSTSNYEQYWIHQWGADGDIPAPADYDGDGRPTSASGGR